MYLKPVQDRLVLLSLDQEVLRIHLNRNSPSLMVFKAGGRLLSQSAVYLHNANGSRAAKCIIRKYYMGSPNQVGSQNAKLQLMFVCLDPRKRCLW